METMVCKTCKKTLPGTESWFPSVDGYLRNECRDCFCKRKWEVPKGEKRAYINERMKAWEKENPGKPTTEKRAEYAKLWEKAANRG